LAFAEKARAFDADPAVQQATELAGVNALAKATVGIFSAESASALKAEIFDAEKLAARNYYNERLDQLVIDHIFGLNK
jgi:xylose isomerase